MQSAKYVSEPRIPELSDSDIQWLQETIGINILNDCKWKSKKYVFKIEQHFKKINKCQLNDQNSDGNTPLHLVAVSENYAAVNGLLMCGADVNALNNLKQTPITYSQQCPDYSPGFQFFRHLHKLAFLGQYICRENRDWYSKILATYNQRYLCGGYVAVLMHDPSLTNENLLRIRAEGEIVICQMYKTELEKISHSSIKTYQLSQILNLTDRSYVAENRLKYLKKYVKSPWFHKKFPIFGFMFKLKYWQTLEHLKSSKEIDQQKAKEARNSFKHDTASNVLVNNSNAEQSKPFESSSNEKVEKLRKMMARLSTQQLNADSIIC